MSKKGTIIVVEDDEDDKKMFESALSALNYSNDVEWFENSDDAFKFLTTTTKSIFIIFSDINLPGQNGLEFKFKIDTDPKLRKKSIPFVFYSTAAYQHDVNEAFTKMTVQGFFKKGIDMEESVQVLKTIFDYWTLSKNPNVQ